MKPFYVSWFGLLNAVLAGGFSAFSGVLFVQGRAAGLLCVVIAIYAAASVAIDITESGRFK